MFTGIHGQHREARRQRWYAEGVEGHNQEKVWPTQRKGQFIPAHFLIKGIFGSRKIEICSLESLQVSESTWCLTHMGMSQKGVPQKFFFKAKKQRFGAPYTGNAILRHPHMSCQAKSVPAAETKDHFVQSLFYYLFNCMVCDISFISNHLQYCEGRNKENRKGDSAEGQYWVNFGTLPDSAMQTSFDRLWRNRMERRIPKVKKRRDWTHLANLHAWTKLRTSNNQNRFPLPGFGTTCRDTWPQGAERVLEKIPPTQAVPCTAPGPVSSFASRQTHETTADAFWKLSHQNHTSRPSQAVETNTHLCVCQRKSRGKGGFRLQQQF